MALTRNEKTTLWVGIAAGIIVTIAAASSWPWWWQYMPWVKPSHSATTSSTSLPAPAPGASPSVTQVAARTTPPRTTSKPAAATSTSPGTIGMSGGCDAYLIYAQNRWNPPGAIGRAAPNAAAKVTGRFGPNETIMVNGWVHSRPAHPTNTAPWNSDIWLHLADDSGWVSFGGVRALPVSFDPTGLSKDGGVPVPTLGKCEGVMQ